MARKTLALPPGNDEDRQEDLQLQNSSLIQQTREEIFEDHPVRQRRYILPTPMIQHVCAIASDRVMRRRRGLVFYGSPQTGKTTCTKELQRLLAREHDHILVFLITSRRTRYPSEANIYRLILESQGHALSSRPDVHLIRNVVKDMIRAGLSRVRGNHFILLIDEMQLLAEVDYEQLMTLHNMLDLQGSIRMSTIGFAQHQILQKRDALLVTGENQLIARFLSEIIKFEGCNSATELRTILNFYDEHSEFPEKSGWSFTEFFAPHAFADGFRLNAYSVELWNALLGSAQGILSIPMEHLTLAIEDLLIIANRNDYPGFRLSNSDLVNVAEQSNLSSFSIFTNANDG
jgi:Cdc6-like AAA superfamily ATPase